MDPMDVQRRLAEAIEHDRIGMLGLVGGQGDHFRPMTAFWEPETRDLWFYSYRDADLARAAGDGGADAMFTFQNKHGTLWACVGGRLHRDHDPERLDRFWSPVVAAWFPKGKEDPDLTLLHLEAESGEVWINEAGPVRFGLEVLKANATRSTPDPGVHEHVRLS